MEARGRARARATRTPIQTRTRTTGRRRREARARARAARVGGDRDAIRNTSRPGWRTIFSNRARLEARASFGNRNAAADASSRARVCEDFRVRVRARGPISPKRPSHSRARGRWTARGRARTRSTVSGKRADAESRADRREDVRDVVAPLGEECDPRGEKRARGPRAGAGSGHRRDSEEPRRIPLSRTCRCASSRFARQGARARRRPSRVGVRAAPARARCSTRGLPAATRGDRAARTRTFPCARPRGKRRAESLARA